MLVILHEAVSVNLKCHTPGSYTHLLGLADPLWATFKADDIASISLGDVDQDARVITNAVDV